jgi:hypothetical protein
MTTRITACLLLCLPLSLWAAEGVKPPVKQVKQAKQEKSVKLPKAQVGKTAKTGAKVRKPTPVSGVDSRTEIRSKATQMAAGIGAAEAALGPQELAIADQVHTGLVTCERGTSVTLAGDPASPGYFNVHGRNFSYRMLPVITSTGAIRLEDIKAGAVWLQLPTKSMLMNQKAGRRVADDCMSPSQVAVAGTLKRDSTRPGLLDGPVTALVKPDEEPDAR